MRTSKFAETLLKRVKDTFTLSFVLNPNEHIQAMQSNPKIIPCFRENGAPKLAIPCFSPDIIKTTRLFQMERAVDRFGGGLYRWENDSFFIFGKKMSYKTDVPHNVFLSLCSITENFSLFETAEVQIDVLGNMNIVNCFFTKIPALFTPIDSFFEEFGGENSWTLERSKSLLKIKLPFNSKLRFLSACENGYYNLNVFKRAYSTALTKGELRELSLNKNFLVKKNHKNTFYFVDHS